MEIEIIEREIDDIDTEENDEFRSKFLSKFEYITVINYRATQIRNMKELGVKNNTPELQNADKYNYDPINIAIQEVNNNRLDYIIIRKYPNGKNEYCKLQKMVISDFVKS